MFHDALTELEKHGLIITETDQSCVVLSSASLTIH